MSQCQYCGTIQPDNENPSSRCSKCGSGMSDHVQNTIRADKRFELVKAMAGVTILNQSIDQGYTFMLPASEIIARADAILTALYGPEPGKDES